MCSGCKLFASHLPARTFREYRSYFSLISRMKFPLRVASRLGVFPETTYEKMFKT